MTFDNERTCNRGTTIIPSSIDQTKENEKEMTEEKNKRPVQINGASVEIDAVPLSENGKMVMLDRALMPLLYAFDGAAVTLSIELKPTIKDSIAK